MTPPAARSSARGASLLAQQRPQAPRALDRAAQVVLAKRLGQVAVRDAPGRERGARLGPPGEHDADRVGLRLPRAGEHVDAVDARHAQVADHDVDALRADHVDPGLAPEREARLPLRRPAPQRVGESAEHAGVVVDEEHEQRIARGLARAPGDDRRGRGAHTARSSAAERRHFSEGVRRLDALRCGGVV